MSATYTNPLQIKKSEPSESKTDPLPYIKNLGPTERLVSGTLGYLFLKGVFKTRGSLRLLFMGLGAELLRRSITGYCHAYSALKKNVSGENSQNLGNANLHLSQAGQHQAEQFQATIDIAKPTEYVYTLFRDFSYWANRADLVASLIEQKDEVLFWTRTDDLSASRHWRIQMTDETENQNVTWKVLEPTDVHLSGSIGFRPLEGNQHSEVTVYLDYSDPDSKFKTPASQTKCNEFIRTALKRFKKYAETGSFKKRDTDSLAQKTQSDIDVNVFPKLANM